MILFKHPLIVNIFLKSPTNTSILTNEIMRPPRLLTLVAVIFSSDFRLTFSLTPITTSRLTKTLFGPFRVVTCLYWDSNCVVLRTWQHVSTGSWIGLLNWIAEPVFQFGPNWLALHYCLCFS